MSLVGTRPPTVDEWEKYELHHRARLAAKPGLRVIQQKVKSENKNIFESGLEYKEFKRKYEINISEAEFLFLKQIYTEKSHLRKKCYRNNLENIILQDVTTCIENADIFLKRDLNEKEYSCDYGLIRSLARIVALLMHPDKPSVKD